MTGASCSPGSTPRRLLAAAGTAVLLLTISAGCTPATAATSPAAVAVATDASPSNLAVAFDTAGVLALLVGIVLPLIVGLVTPLGMNGGLKALVLAGLSAATAFCAQWLDALHAGQPFAWPAAALSAIATLLLAIGTHYHVWKPTGLAGLVGAAGVQDPPGRHAAAED